MSATKGMLMQKNGRNGVVMTPDGNFVKVKLNSHTVQIGEEVEGSIYTNRNFFATMIAAAVLLLIILIPGYNMYYPQAIAYVALDINPSIEFAIDKNMSITEAQGLNADGKKILSEVDLTSLQLYQALPILVERAIEDGYIKAGQENVVLSTVTVSKKSKEDISELDEIKIQKAINKPIQSNKISARVVVSHADEEVRSKAKDIGLSTGKYLIYQQAKEQGLNMSVKDLNDHNIKQLEQSKKIKLEQLLQKHISPGHLKQLEKRSNGDAKKVELQPIPKKNTNSKPPLTRKNENKKVPSGLEKKTQKSTDKNLDINKTAPGQTKKIKQELIENKKKDKTTPVLKDNNRLQKDHIKIENKLEQKQQKPNKTPPKQGEKELMNEAKDKKMKDDKIKGKYKNKN
ncbi:MAG: anti-sigma factor domain-containing protein [Firmicutes bacterium]|nr:anti-sigma factor domain-containing protein [Bacillota bacterium]